MIEDNLASYFMTVMSASIVYNGNFFHNTTNIIPINANSNAMHAFRATGRDGESTTETPIYVDDDDSPIYVYNVTLYW